MMVDDNVGVVYVMYCKTGQYKIGRAKIGSTRYGEYTKLPKDTIYLSTCVFEDYVDFEKELHEKYQKYNTNGEWFDLPQNELNNLMSDINERAVGIYDITSKRVKNRIKKKERHELNRTDVLLMLTLENKSANAPAFGLTISEIIKHIETNGNDKHRMTVYRRLKALCNEGFVSKGMLSDHADTFYLLDKGRNVILNLEQPKKQTPKGRDALLNMRKQLSNS